MGAGATEVRQLLSKNGGGREESIVQKSQHSLLTKKLYEGAVCVQFACQEQGRSELAR